MWDSGVYELVLDTDAPAFMGEGRVDPSVDHHTFPEEWAGRRNHMCIYTPCRSAQVYARKADK